MSNMRTHIAARRASLPKALEDDHRQHLEKTFEDYMYYFLWSTCKVCHESILSPKCYAQKSPSNRCMKHPLRFTAASNMDPLDVPNDYLACPRRISAYRKSPSCDISAQSGKTTVRLSRPCHQLSTRCRRVCFEPTPFWRI